MTVRKRVIGKGNSTVTAARKLMRELFKNKQTQTAIKKQVSSQEEKLKELIPEGSANVTTSITIEGEKVFIEAGWGETNRTVLDLEKLKELIGVEGFAEIASVTQKAITDAYGNDVLSKCSHIEKTNSWKSVKIAKAK